MLNLLKKAFHDQTFLDASKQKFYTLVTITSLAHLNYEYERFSFNKRI